MSSRKAASCKKCAFFYTCLGSKLCGAKIPAVLLYDINKGPIMVIDGGTMAISSVTIAKKCSLYTEGKNDRYSQSY